MNRVDVQTSHQMSLTPHPMFSAGVMPCKRFLNTQLETLPTNGWGFVDLDIIGKSVEDIDPERLWPLSIRPNPAAAADDPDSDS